MQLEKKINEYYEIFKGLPTSNPIVRQNIKNDAFEVLVYDILFRKNKFIGDLTIEDIEEIEKCIPAAPDDGIDIFYENEEDENFTFHIVQVKNSKQNQREIKDCFATMKRTMETYVKDTTSIGKNLKTVLSNYIFDENGLEKCKYYVVHKGDLASIQDQNENEKIITADQLQVVIDSIQNFSVPFEEIEINNEENYIGYTKFNDPQNEQTAFQVNLNAYLLAQLCSKYLNTDIGRNILFGQNIRETIVKGSKTYLGMCKTIEHEPENFWLYNNGITIIANDIIIVERENKRFFQLKNFSIINGAQTTSTFSQYYNDAFINKKQEKIEKLKKVFVAARLVKTGTNDQLKRNITIFNNTQNPISSRDMVANNVEQLQLQKKLKDNMPSIFLQIRRGEVKPRLDSYNKFRIISNDEIAQLCFAGFLRKPFVAKDKKTTLFNRDNSNSNFILNADYDSIFRYSMVDTERGELFKRTNHEIDELLFVRLLHDKSKKSQKEYYDEQLEHLNSELIVSPVENQKDLKIRIEAINRLKQINNINTFYNIALYWEFKRKFDKILKFSNRSYDIPKFLKDKQYAKSLVNDFAKLFNALTISIFIEKCGGNPSQFVRARKSQDTFFESLEVMLSLSKAYRDDYESFVNKYKIDNI